MLIALCVPLCNVAAVWPLARHGGHAYGRELLCNPLILATVAGRLGNAAGLKFPDAVATTLQRIGLAAPPVGLMAVGAGLSFGALRESTRLAAAPLAIRHAVLPIVAIGLCAARMGGSAPLVAGLVTVSTLVGMVSVPFWLAVSASLR